MLILVPEGCLHFRIMVDLERFVSLHPSVNATRWCRDFGRYTVCHVPRVLYTLNSYFFPIPSITLSLDIKNVFINKYLVLIYKQLLYLGRGGNVFALFSRAPSLPSDPRTHSRPSSALPSTRRHECLECVCSRGSTSYSWRDASSVVSKLSRQASPVTASQMKEIT